MDTKNNFNDWFGTYRALVPSAAFKNLAIDLRERIQAKRALYNKSNLRVQVDILNGQLRRPYGRRKLTLTPTELVAHMEARRDRAKAQQELRVLVPLYRRVMAAVQSWPRGANAPAAALEVAVWLLPLTTPFHRRRQVLDNVPEHMLKWVYGDKVEQDIATDLARQHPMVFFMPTLGTPAERPAPQPHMTALYEKIVSGVQLTPEEQKTLANALLTSPA